MVTCIRIRVILATLVFGFCFGLANAQEKRVALVIGNSDYQHLSELANPGNDAEAIAAALSRLQFEVIKGGNLTRTDFLRKLDEFSEATTDADIALFYFAGHGVQVNGLDYLIPVESQLFEESDLETGAIGLKTVLSRIESKPRTRVVILDTSRSNPWAQDQTSSMDTRSSMGGGDVARIDFLVELLIAYATQPGNIAMDGNGNLSPFTKALVNHIETPGEDFEAVLRRVRQEVFVETDGRQVPWSSSSLTGPLVLSQATEAGADSTNKQKAVDDFAEWLTSSQEVIARAFQLSIRDGLLPETAQSELASRAEMGIDENDYSVLTAEALGSNGPLLEFLVRNRKSGSPVFVVSRGTTGTIASQFEAGDNPVIDLAIPPDYEGKFVWASVIDTTGIVTNLFDGSVPVAESAAWTQSAELAGIIDGRFVRLTWSLQDKLDVPDGRLALMVDDSGPRGAVLVTALFSDQPFTPRPTQESLAAFLRSLDEIELSGAEIEAIHQTLRISD